MNSLAEVQKLIESNLDFPSAKDMRKKTLQAKWGGVLYILTAALDSVNSAAEKGEFSATLTLSGIKSTIDVESATDALKNLGYDVVAGAPANELTAGEYFVRGQEFTFKISWHKE